MNTGNTRRGSKHGENRKAEVTVKKLVDNHGIVEVMALVMERCYLNAENHMETEYDKETWRSFGQMIDNAKGSMEVKIAHINAHLANRV